MKKLLLIIGLLGWGWQSSAQEVENNLSLGSGYINQVWYNLESEVGEEAALKSWDLAFGRPKGGRDLGSIYINGGKGIELALYPHSNLDGWDGVSVAENEFDNWPKLNNLPYTWSAGAFNVSDDPGNDSDYSWGMYYMGSNSSINHHVIGDSLYIIKLSDNKFKKLAILDYNPHDLEFTLKHADLDGGNEKQVVIGFSGFTEKNFAYYSIETDEQLDLEPASKDWHLLFTRYIDDYPSANGIIPYKVTGVLLNKGMKAAVATDVEDPETFKDYENLVFTDSVNKIGYNWKTLDYSTFKYVLEKNVYFIQVPVLDQNGNQVNGPDNKPQYEVWKLRFTEFAGSSTGAISFATEKLLGTPTSITTAPLAGYRFRLFPNPATSGYVYLDFENESSESATITLSSLLGEKLQVVDYKSSSNPVRLETSSLESGIYIVTVEKAGSASTQKIIIH